MKKKPQKISKSNKGLLIGSISLVILYVCSSIYFSIRNFTKDTEDISSLGEYSFVDDALEIRSPKNWVLIQTSQGNHGDMEVIAGAYAVGSFFPGLAVARRSESLDSNVNSMDSWALDRIKVNDTTLIGNLASFTSDFLSGNTRDYIYDTHNRFAPNMIKCRDYYFLVENNQYIFSFCVHEDEWKLYVASLEKIIDTLRVRGKN